MKSILIIGLGRFGRHIAQKLNELDYQVMAIDKREERVQDALPYVTNAQIGDSTRLDFMQTVGVRNFDVCICAIGDDFQSSLETTLLLKELGAPLVVSRAARDVHAKFLKRNGADEVVYPEKQLAIWTAIRFASDHVFDYIEVGGDYSIFEVEIPRGWNGKTVSEIDIRKKYGINILAMKRDGKVYPDVHADTVFNDVYTLLVLGKYSTVQKCFKL
ncbi:MAG: potassium channel family protein [Oscillospiraceae bacterium]